jgi:hypothetical protein
MPKKKTTKREATPTITATDTTDDLFARFVEVGQWHKIPNYTCRLDGFATLDEREMRKHLDGLRPHPDQQVGAQRIVTDRYGNALTSPNGEPLTVEV